MRVLDKVPIRTDKSGRFCDINCPLLTYVNGTCCSLERAVAAKAKLKSRYNWDEKKYERCPACLRLERRAKVPEFDDGV